MEIVYLSRWQVGYRTDLPRLGYPVAPTRREGIVEHHTVGGRLISVSEAQALEYVRRLQTIRPDLGYDVPYSFVVSYIAAGRLLICEGRGWDRTGAHTAGQNTRLLAWGWQGDHHTGTIPDLDDAQRSLGRWIRTHADRQIPGHSIDWDALVPPVYGHRQFKDTTCPGDSLYGTLGQIVEGFTEDEEDGMEVGDQGQAVRIAQIYLQRMSDHRQLGLTVDADGVFGPATAAAVNTAKGWYGLAADGRIDGVFMGLLSTYGASIVLPGHAADDHAHPTIPPGPHSHSGSVTVS